MNQEHLISKTMQRIQTGLVPLCSWEPAHSNTMGLICSLGCPQWKIYCLIIEGATHSTFQWHPSAPRASTTTNIRLAAGSCSFLVVQKSCRKMLQRWNRKQGLKYMIHSRLSYTDMINNRTEINHGDNRLYYMYVKEGWPHWIWHPKNGVQASIPCSAKGI